LTDQRRTVIEYRLERAHATLNSAKFLAESGDWFSCVNRLYYSCFYAVVALLLAYDMSSAKHTGVRSLFNREFVHTEKVSTELGSLYNALFVHRMEIDYQDLVEVDRERTVFWLDAAETFLKEIESLTRAKMSLK